MVDNIPGIEPVLKVLLQEDGNALQGVTKSISSATQKVVDVKDTVTGYFGGSKEEEKPVPSKRMNFYYRLIRHVSSVLLSVYS